MRVPVKNILKGFKSKSGSLKKGLREVSGKDVADLGHGAIDTKEYLDERKKSKVKIAHIQQAFLKMAKGYKEVAAVAVVCDGKLLMGKRKDNQKWTQPGGHMEAGETPIQGAIRELKEETGITASASQLKSMGSRMVAGGKIKVHGFLMECSTKPSTSMSSDPDEEVYRWVWKETDPLPSEVKSNLHVPNENIVLDHLKIKY